MAADHKIVVLLPLDKTTVVVGAPERTIPCPHFIPRQVEDNPLPWLPETAWQAVAALGELEEFNKFSSDLVEAGPRFREWFNHITPETEKLPLDW